MKGVVFTEFLEMVEERFSPDLAFDIIEQSALPSQGVYTTVGTYPHTEMIALVNALSDRTGISGADLQRAFGAYLFGRFAEQHPSFFDGAEGALQLLEKVDSYIHVEVRKLYPQAELPSFECESSEGLLTMTYSSTRPFAALAEGLIRGCIEHFGEPIDVEIVDLSDGAGTSAKFVLTEAPRS